MTDPKDTKEDGMARMLQDALIAESPDADLLARYVEDRPSLSAEELRQAVRAKDVMWRQFWVPPNWAFLYGNRQTTASSRSHTDRGYRWFPEEIQTIPSLLNTSDEKIWKQAKGLN